MSCLCVIPARLKASRFPEKVLALWRGKTILQHTWEKACAATNLNRVIIACDHSKIYDIAKSFGAEVLMTSTTHATGSDRVAEVLNHFTDDYCVNLQADEPEMCSRLLNELIVCLKTSRADCATVISDKVEIENLNCVKVVTNYKGEALYFSRTLRYGFRHVGLYAYTRSALFRFVDLPAGTWEQAENLEQLRLLEAGMRIQTIKANYDGIAIDTKEDLKRLLERG